MTRTKAKRQTKRAARGKANAAPAGQEARDAETAKATFLAAFGHGPEYHGTTEPPSTEAIWRNFAAAGTGDPRKVSCGWWFCLAVADSVSWLELAKALKCLLRAGINPHGPDVARLGHEYARVRGWAAERDAYQVLRESLRSLRAKLPSTSDAERLRKQWLAELNPLHRNAFEAKPLDGGRANQPRQAVIALTKPAGWTHAHVAASLVLTGAEKLTADRDFKTIKDELRKAFGRVSRR